LLNTGLSGVADGLGIYTGHAIDNLAGDLSGLLGLGGCDMLCSLPAWPSPAAWRWRHALAAASASL
jgi:hypothetical protein